MTVFSCLVNGFWPILNLENNLQNEVTKKKPSRPAAMLSDGMMPVVKPSLRLMMEKQTPRMTATKKLRTVRVDFQGGSCGE